MATGYAMQLPLVLFHCAISDASFDLNLMRMAKNRSALSSFSGLNMHPVTQICNKPIKALSEIRGSHAGGYEDCRFVGGSRFFRNVGICLPTLHGVISQNTLLVNNCT